MANTNTERIFVFEDKRYLIEDMHFEYSQNAESYSGRPSTHPLHSNILLYLRPMGKYKDQALIMQYALKRNISGHIEFLITDNGLENKIMSDLEFANAKIKRIGISSQHPGFEGQDILRVEIKPYIVKFQDEISELPTNPSNPFAARTTPVTTREQEEEKFKVLSGHYQTPEGDYIRELENGIVHLIIKSKNTTNNIVDVDLTDEKHDFLYEGKPLKDDKLIGLQLTGDSTTVILEVVDQKLENS